jgi:enoyl-[acyl-carrier protein] reductase II
MGTRFMTTKESPLHDNFKRLSIEKGVADTFASLKIDGIPCRVLRTESAQKAERRGLNLIAAFSNSREIAAQIRIPYIKLFLGVMASGWKNARQLAFLANGFKAFHLATENGDLKRGVLPVGQVTGLLRDEPTVKEVIERIVAEAKQVREKLDGQIG